MSQDFPLNFPDHLNAKLDMVRKKYLILDRALNSQKPPKSPDKAEGHTNLSRYYITSSDPPYFDKEIWNKKTIVIHSGKEFYSYTPGDKNVNCQYRPGRWRFR